MCIAVRQGRGFQLQLSMTSEVLPSASVVVRVHIHGGPFSTTGRQEIDWISSRSILTSFSMDAGKTVLSLLPAEVSSAGDRDSLLPVTVLSLDVVDGVVIVAPLSDGTALAALPGAAADLNADTMVGIEDLLILLANWS